MKLQKLSIFIWGALLFVFILNFYFNFFRFPFLNVNLFEAIPEHSAVIIECNNLESLNNSGARSTFWNSVQKTSLFEKIQKDLFEIQSRLVKKEDSSVVFQNNQFLAALQISSAQSADFLYIIDADGIRFDAEALIEEHEKIKINKSVFLKETVYELIFPDNQRFTVCFYNNLILFSRFPFMVEDAIAQLNNPRKALSGQKNFQLAKKSIDGDPGVSVYFNFRQIPQLVNPSGRKSNLDHLKNVDSWVTLNFYSEGDSLVIDGTYITDSGSDFKQGAINSSASKIFEVIPDNCSFLFWQSNNKAAFKKNDPIFKNYVQPWIGEEQAIFLTESRQAALEDEQFIICQAKDAELAIRYLNQYADTKGKLEEIDYQTFTIYQLFADEVLQTMSLFNQDGFENPFYTSIGEYVVFSNSRQSLEVLIDKHILGQTLSNNAAFLQFQKELLPVTNTWIYCNVPLFTPFLRQLTTDAGQKDFETFFDILSSLNSLGVQLEQSGKKSDLRFYFDASGDHAKGTKSIWTARLAAHAIIQPAVVKNAKTHQNEIFVQDAENRIYLFDRNGKIIWERKLKSPILSKIRLIQYYEGTEGQLLFNTKDQIYLIDHEGNDVSAFPINLPSPASNGLCLIDFENNKEYQFFIGTENGFIYGFEKTGEPVAGWNPKENAGKLLHDLEHFQVSGNDYILALNESGAFDVFKRNGEKHFETVAFDTKYLSPPGFQVFENNARIVMANHAGKANVFNQKGKHFNLYAGTGSDKNVRFLFADVTGDDRKDYISLSGRDLSCYYYEKSDFKKTFDARFEQPQDELFAVQIPGDNKFQIGTLDKTGKRINLLTGAGRLSEGFPLAGTTEFSIVDLFDANGKVLVVAFENSIYASKVE